MQLLEQELEDLRVKLKEFQSESPSLPDDEFTQGSLQEEKVHLQNQLKAAEESLQSLESQTAERTSQLEDQVKQLESSLQLAEKSNTKSRVDVDAGLQHEKLLRNEIHQLRSSLELKDAQLLTLRQTSEQRMHDTLGRAS